MVGTSKPTEEGARLVPISMFIIRIIIIAENTFLSLRVLHVLTHLIFQTTREDGCIITNTSGLWNQGTEHLRNVPRATS